MATIFQQATDQVKHLNKKETWKFEYDDKYGGLTELVTKCFHFDFF